MTRSYQSRALQYLILTGDVFSSDAAGVILLTEEGGGAALRDPKLAVTSEFCLIHK